MDQEAAPLEANAGCFVFAGVELDPDHCTLRVDGRVVACSRKAFELLLQLCRVSNRVQSRDELIASLWPGGQIVSDEALTQVIFRARAVLGRHAGVLLTVRGVGLRLGVPVTRRQRNSGDANSPPGNDVAFDASADLIGNSAVALEQTPVALAVAPSDAEAMASATFTPVRADGALANPRIRLLWFAALVALILVGLVAGLRFGTSPAPVAALDAGYGLFETDLHSEDPQTASSIRDAFSNDAKGDRDRGEALLQAVHEADTSTPVPAAFLALWAAGTGKGERAAEWLALAKQRAQPLHDVYVNLLLGYVAAELNGGPDTVLRQAGALLDLRPQAWRMRLARAHLMVVANLRTAALHELQQIDVPALGNRKLEMVIADRASLGDIAGAQAMLDRLPEQDDATHAYLRGRIAWSRGDFDASYLAYRRCAAASVDTAQADLRRRALTSVAAIEVLRRQDEAAITTLEQARVSMGTSEDHISNFDTSLFLAELHARAGNRAATDLELERAVAAASKVQSEEFKMIAALVAARLRPAIETPVPTAIDAGSEALWRARVAWNQGQQAVSALALTDAIRRGVLQTRMVEEARYLAWQLGQPVPAELALDPPFPPLAVVVLRRDLREASAAGQAAEVGVGVPISN